MPVGKKSNQSLKSGWGLKCHFKTQPSGGGRALAFQREKLQSRNDGCPARTSAISSKDKAGTQAS